jgi:hypothetical protein
MNYPRDEQEKERWPILDKIKGISFSYKKSQEERKRSFFFFFDGRRVISESERAHRDYMLASAPLDRSKK